MENLDTSDVMPAMPSKSRKKLWLTISGVLVLVILGAGYAWYWAYGQVYLLNQQMTWQWLTEQTNFQVQSSMDYQIEIAGVEDNSYASFLPKKFQLTGNSNHFNSGQDFTGSVDLDLLVDEKKLEINADYLKKEDLVFLRPVIIGLKELFAGLGNVLGVKEFEVGSAPQIDYSTGEWIKFDVPQGDSNFSEDSLVKSTNKFNEFLDKAKERKIFKIKDIHQTKDTQDGKLKAVQYVIPREKVETLINTIMEMDENKNGQENYAKFKNEKPEQWAKMQDAISKITFVLWINTKTKNIQGLDTSIQDLNIDYGETSVIIDWAVSYLIVSADPLDIAAPTNTITPQEFFNNLMQETGLGAMFGMPGEPLDFDHDGLIDTQEEVYGTDPTNPDSDGDGYPDGEEVNNGYNPMGEGELEVVGENTQLSFIDCGEDQECFKQYTKSCTPAKVMIENQNLKSEYRLEGFDGDNCQYRLTFIAWSEILNGKDILCLIPSEKLSLASEDIDTFIRNNQNEICSGEALDIINQYNAD